MYDRNTPADRTLAFHGSGHAITFACGNCGKPSSQLGSKTKFLRGLRRKVCAMCARLLGAA